MKPVQRLARTPLSPAWKKLFADLSGRRAHIGLSRLARYASANGIEPEEINDAAIEGFITAVRNGTLHRRPNDLHRKVALIWNEAAQRSEFDLQTVEVPSFRRPAKTDRLDAPYQRVPQGRRRLPHWCGGSDLFAADARSRALAPQTVKLRRNQIHAAVTALVESGVKPTAIRSLADLVSPENFKRILRRRHEMVGGGENVFNHDLARALVQIARRWVKVDAGTLAELTQLAGKVPMPVSGLTDKNKRGLRQFDDPAVLRRLYEFSESSLGRSETGRQAERPDPGQGAGCARNGILCYMPIRRKILRRSPSTSHLFLQEAPGAISSLELSAGEVKNRRDGLRYPSRYGQDVDRIPQPHRAENHRPSARQVVCKCRWHPKTSGRSLG